MTRYEASQSANQHRDRDRDRDSTEAENSNSAWPTDHADMFASMCSSSHRLDPHSSISFGSQQVASFSYAKHSVRTMSRLEHASSRLSTHLEDAVVGLTDADKDGDGDSVYDPSNVLRDKAVVVIRRVKDKLTGMDFSQGTGIGGRGRGGAGGGGLGGDGGQALDVAEQVDRLINLATSTEHLCMSFFGWCPFW